MATYSNPLELHVPSISNSLKFHSYRPTQKMRQELLGVSLQKINFSRHRVLENEASKDNNIVTSFDDQLTGKYSRPGAVDKLSYEDVVNRYF